MLSVNTVNRVSNKFSNPNLWEDCEISRGGVVKSNVVCPGRFPKTSFLNLYTPTGRTKGRVSEITAPVQSTSLTLISLQESLQLVLLKTLSFLKLYLMFYLTTKTKNLKIICTMGLCLSNLKQYKFTLLLSITNFNRIFKI